MATVCTCDQFEVDAEGKLCLTLGCGLRDAAGGGVEAAVFAWPFACAQTGNMRPVYCNPANGLLGTDPRFRSRLLSGFESDITDRTLTPGQFADVEASINIDLTDWCEDAIASLNVGAFFDLNLSLTPGAHSFEVSTRRTLDAVPATFDVAVAVDGTDELRWSERAVQGSDQFSVSGGAVHTYLIRSRVTNTGSTNIQLLTHDVFARGFILTSHPNP